MIPAVTYLHDWFTEAGSPLWWGSLPAIISLCIGVPSGLIAGYYKGIWESIVMRTADIFMSFLVHDPDPGAGIRYRTFCMDGYPGHRYSQWTDFAKLIYGNVLSVREKEYVESAKAVGTKDIPLLIKYVIPERIRSDPDQLYIPYSAGNHSGVCTRAFGYGRSAAGGILGNILYAAQSITVLSSRPWLWVPPGILLVLTVSSINFIGDGIRMPWMPKPK